MKTIIIAEAGVNHNGSTDIAFKLIDAAFVAGADYIKFQTFKAENLVSKIAAKADYQILNTGNTEETQFEMLRKLELSYEQHEMLIEYCNQKGIKFFSTAFDQESLQYLADIGLDIVKIPSGEITNLPYLKKAAKLFKKVIISTGMCTLQEIRNAFDVFISGGIKHNDITILHCNTEYPTPMADVNLKALDSIRNEFGTRVGYSDHTVGIEVPIACVALGATMIEKHFTLDKAMDGPDHKASLEPDELKAMVDAVRNIEMALSGNGIKEPSASELKNIFVARKSIVAKTDIKMGEIYTEKNLTVKRPGNGISAMEWDNIIGKIAKKDFREDEMISI